jgi:hypothetical protein
VVLFTNYHYQLFNSFYYEVRTIDELLIQLSGRADDAMKGYLQRKSESIAQLNHTVVIGGF